MTFDINFKPELNLEAAIEQVDPVPLERCRTCQRWGLPILPLRAAYAPEPWQTQALPVSRDSEVTAVRMVPDQPRILRRGFLYVLLDRKHWQAYQITPEGALRQFPALQVPREEPVPLSTLCVQQDHDIPAAFLNINTHRYSTAWLAIANDPWPKEVLRAYKHGGVVDGMNLDERFYKLDLKVAREDPASVGIAMTETDLQLQQVLEYSYSMAGDFRSVHGFYPRNDRLRAMAGHVRAVTKEYQLPKGVLALVLPDPLGMVQELNAQRLVRYQAMQEWVAEPERCFKHFTSQTLLGIRQFQVSTAHARAIEEAKAAVKSREDYNAIAEKSQGYPSYMTPMPALDPEQEKERRSTEAIGDARKRLDERYNEEARNTFQDHYDKTLAAWQKIVDDVAELYVSHHDGAAFRLAALHDYDRQVTESHDDFLCMLAKCHAGGVTEARTAKEFGATRSLWLEQLEDQDSLFHKAMRARDKTGFEQFADDLAGDEQTRVFHGGKTLIGAMKADEFVGTRVQTAVGQLLGAAATASNALGEHLSEKSRALLLELHRKVWLRYYGVQTTRITISLKLGEYLTLLNQVLYEGVERYASKLDQQFRKPAERKVRAMLLNNYFAPALASSHAKLIDVVVWTTESAESLQGRLEKLEGALGDGIYDALRTVSINGTALKGGMQDLIRHLSVNAEAARLLAGDSMRTMRNAVHFKGTGAANLTMATGSLYFQQDALRRSYENMLKTIGDEHDEAVAAVLSASVGVMGAGVEIVGGTIQMLRPDLKVSVRTAGEMVPVELGGRILQVGGAIVSAATAVEGVQYALAAGRTGEVGDKAASNFYKGAAAASGASAVFGVAGSVWGTSMLLGPLAIAVFVGFVAFGLAVWAKRLESQPLEFWARHSLWGLPVEHRRWLESHEMDTAIGALNAALLGLIAQLDVVHQIQARGKEILGSGGFIDYKIVLPGYKADASRYEWTLWAYRQREVPGQIIAGGRSDGTNGPLPAPALWKQPAYLPATTAPVIQHDAESQTLEIKGSISFLGKLDFHALELEVSFWPDKSDESGVARLVVKEDKISGQQGWDSHE